MPSASSGQEIKNTDQVKQRKWHEQIKCIHKWLLWGAVRCYWPISSSQSLIIEKINENGSIGPSDIRDIVIPVLF